MLPAVTTKTSTCILHIHTCSTFEIGNSKIHINPCFSSYLVHTLQGTKSQNRWFTFLEISVYSDILLFGWDFLLLAHDLDSADCGRSLRKLWWGETLVLN